MPCQSAPQQQHPPPTLFQPQLALAIDINKMTILVIAYLCDYAVAAPCASVMKTNGPSPDIVLILMNNSLMQLIQ